MPPPGDPGGPTGPSELLLYTTTDRGTRIEVRLEDETVWLSQAQMAELFQTTKQNVSLHIRNIYDEGELERPATVKESLTVQPEGGRQVQRQIEIYNLDVIISVGYRVKSHRGVQFRIWATQRLREYLVKGFALDDERLKEVDQYLSFAEFQAQLHRPMTMQDWTRKLEDFLKLNERDILTDAGRISHELATAKAGREFEKFDADRPPRRSGRASISYPSGSKSLRRKPSPPRQGRTGSRASSGIAVSASSCRPLLRPPSALPKTCAVPNASSKL